MKLSALCRNPDLVCLVNPGRVSHGARISPEGGERHGCGPYRNLPQRFLHFPPQGFMEPRTDFRREFDGFGIAEKFYGHLRLIDNQLAIFTRRQVVLDFP